MTATAAKRTKAAPKRTKPAAKRATTAKALKAPAKKKPAAKRSTKAKVVASMKTLPKNVLDYIKANPKLALSAVAGVGLAVATSIVGPLKVLKLATNPALVALVKEAAERALESARAAV
jgi:hypothetical protein